MEPLQLLLPDLSWANELAAYRQEMLDAGSSMDGCGPLRRLADPADWLREVENYTRPETLPPGLVIATQFLAVRPAEHRLVGMLQLRHTLNDYLEQYAGHIGYSVRPSERRRGVAKWMLGACLPYCRALGLERVLISCEVENEGSRRTILANGGVYDKTVFEPSEQIWLERYWVPVP